MFYSHQLLARKAPLGQIWMAATMHAKINRRKLDKLDIIKICEEILNPSVPMALRLSGILMGGVVIVYERKVKLLYDDVTRFLVEINEAWKVKSVADPTVLPKRKSQAKYEAVTLPDNVDMEVERTMHFSDASFTAAAARFQRMRFDDLDEHYININPRDEDLSQHHHQAEAANITLFEDFGSCLAETDLYDRFERFDIGEDEETQINFTPQEHPQVPPTLRPSPPPQDAHPQAPTSRMSSPPTQHEPPQDGYQVEEQEDRQTEAHKETAQEAEGHARRQGPSKRKARTQVIMDNEQIMIPGNIYQMWLQDASDIVSKRGRKNKPHNPILTTKIAILMELPPVALISGLERFPGELHYPAPLLELWRTCTQATPAHGSSSGGKSTEAQHNPASHSPPEGLSHRNIIPEFPVGDFQSEIGSHPMGISIEKGRPEHENIGLQATNEAVFSDHFDTPRSPGQSSKSIPSSGSGRTFLPLEPEMPPPSARYKRRHFGNLDPVEEDRPLQQNLRGFKIPRLYEDGPTPDIDLLEETGPTQTPHPVIFDPSVDKITQSIRTHLKLHFDTPGAPQSESLNQLASGMSRKKAAQLFYQTCVLATCDFVKVHQAEAYGDIVISRGPKM